MCRKKMSTETNLIYLMRMIVNKARMREKVKDKRTNMWWLTAKIRAAREGSLLMMMKIKRMMRTLES